MYFKTFQQCAAWVAYNYLQQADPEDWNCKDALNIIKLNRNDFGVTLPDDFGLADQLSEGVDKLKEIAGKPAPEKPVLPPAERRAVALSALEARLEEDAQSPGPYPHLLMNVARLGEAFGLDKFEQFQLISYSMALSGAGKLIIATRDSMSAREHAKYFGVDEQTMVDILEERGKLWQAGLLGIRGEGDRDERGEPRLSHLAVPKALREALHKPAANTEQLVRGYPWEKIETKLTLDDFSHLRVLPELQMIVQNLLDHPQLGANVTLYGPVGTGKTELTALLARACGAEAYSIGLLGEKGEPTRAERLQQLKLARQVAHTAKLRVLIVLDESDDILRSANNDEKAKQGSKAHINERLTESTVPTVYITNDPDVMDPATIRRLMPAIPVYPGATAERAALLVKQGQTAGIALAPAQAMMLAQRYHGQTAGMSAAHFRTATLAGGDSATLETWFALGERALHGGTMPLPAGAGCLPEPFLPDAYEFAGRDTAPAMALAHAVSLARASIVLLSGTAGLGKTGFAQHLAQKAGQPLCYVDYAELLEGDYRKNIAKMLESARGEGARLLVEDIAPLHKRPSPHNDSLFRAVAQHPHGAILTQDGGDEFACPPAGVTLTLQLLPLPQARAEAVAQKLFGQPFSVPDTVSLAELVQAKRQWDAVREGGGDCGPQALLDGLRPQRQVGFQQPARAPVKPFPNS